MGATVIVVDTNQIRDSPMLRNRDWMELIAKAGEWDLRFVVPEVCLVEATNVVRRKWTEDVRTPLAKLKLGEFGLAESQQAMDEVIDAAINGYADALRARLAEIGADVVKVPDSIEWTDVVQRASDRRAPYGQGQKDGFRDTLIWYSTRAVAVEDLECDVWLISTNHNDFGGNAKTDSEACPYPLHPHLIEELQIDGSQSRVSYVRTLGRLVQHLAGTYDALPAEKREALVAQLDREGFERELADSVRQLPLNPSAAALPVRTVTASIQSSVNDSETLEFVDAAMRGGGGWTAQFRQSIEAIVDLVDLAGDTGTAEKELSVAGRLEVGADGNVRQLLVTSIEALPDDPARRAWVRWQSSDAMKSLLAQDIVSSFHVSPTSDLMEEYFKSMPTASDQMRDLLRDFQSPLDSLKDSPGMLDALKNIQSPLDALKNSPGMLDALKNIQSPLDALKNSPGMLDALKNIQSPLDSLKNSPGMLDALKNIQSPLDALKDSLGKLGAFETRRPGDVEESVARPGSNEAINLSDDSSEAGAEVEDRRGGEESSED